MLLTKTQAIVQLRRETRRSVQWCTDTVRRLATIKDGQRMKVRNTVLDAVIRMENAPKEAPKGVRSISPKKAARIQERCI